jgi:hypothetical protein
MTTLDWPGALAALQGMIGRVVSVQIVSRSEGTVAVMWGGLGGDAAQLLPKEPGEHEDAAKFIVGFKFGDEETRGLSVGFFQLEPPPVFQGAVWDGSTLNVTTGDVVVKVQADAEGTE